MPALSDAVLIGTVLTLVFAAVAYYLYTRIIQNESKLSLMESILLNLKMATEATLLAGSREEMHMAHHHNHVHNNGYGHVQMEEMVMPSKEDNATPSQSDETSLYQQMIEEAHKDVASNSVSDEIPQEIKDISVSASPPSSASSAVLHVTKDDSGNSKVHIGFESMSYKELCSEASKRGITGVSRMNRRKLIDVLNKKDGIVVEENTPVTTTDKLFDLPPAKEFPDGVELAPL